MAKGVRGSCVVIRAAGGIVWKETPEGRKVAVVHRARYDDWCLPKGKLREGESWEEAAVREVKEETGCEVFIVGVAGSVSYEVKGTSKTVRFYNMRVLSENSFMPSEEVRALVWLSPAEALNKLDYKGERDVLSSQLTHSSNLLSKASNSVDFS